MLARRRAGARGKRAPIGDGRRSRRHDSGNRQRRSLELDCSSQRARRSVPQLPMTRRPPDIGGPRESGTITLWMLGLCLMLFLLGGISLDLWRAFSERRSLAATADAAGGR